MNPEEFDQAALEIVLRSPPPGPAWCRTAISRAYFAALNRAAEALAGLGASCGKGPQKHGQAVRFLHATDDPDLKTASATLDHLRTERNRADYDMDDPLVERVAQARRAVEAAKEIMDYLEAVENDPARRTAAESNIKSYKQKTNLP
jgi:hypothetical protein